MAKKSIARTESDGSEKLLVEMIERFSTRRAIDWLRVKFPSFDTGRAEAIACDATKNERDYFASAELLGHVTRMPQGKTDDANRPLVVAAVKMKKDMTERTSRLVQFNFAKKILQGAVTGGAKGLSGLPSQGLFFFYDKNGCFRLSLVSGEVEKRRFKFNAAKRQSFYVEPRAANNIVKRRLTPAVRAFDELKDVFSVEQLTKEFYTRLFDWYTWAMSPKVNVRFPNDLDDKTKGRKYNNEALIRMITRLMFTWFIRQRKLVPDEIFDREALGGILKKFEPDSMEQDNYYRAILQNLFFATFNSAPDKRQFIKIFQGHSGQRHVTTLYRHKKEFVDAKAFRTLMRKVPFLNCALFDCIDKVESRKYFDGFSGEKGRSAHVPNGLFFDKERGIVSLFNRYEFTVNENDADDSDVALDPELLGKVFENLLGAYNPETRETARNATGSFYTPREIVDYMVEESLKNYLKTRLGNGTGGTATAELDRKLEDLFDRNKAAEGAETEFSGKEREALLKALYECKILDPACGSGAFPMGVLHCMVRLLTRLDPQSISIRQHLLDRYRVDKAAVDPAESAADREERLAELESRLREGQHYPDYERKLYLIENCIYGVDIQPIATQISKLRFFISLLCDQLRTSYDPEAENFGLLSLPNLEAKFVCANTLVSLPAKELDITVGNIAELRRELQANRHRIFRARSTRTKEKYKNRDLEIRDAIRATVRDSLSKPDEDVIAKCREQIADARKRRVKVAEPDWVEEEVAVQADFFSAFEKKKIRRDRNAPARDKIDAEISWAEETIKKEQSKADRSNVAAATRYADMVAGWDPYDQNASSPFFDPEWMFNNTTGFDVVIGNPPYISHDQIPSNTPCKCFNVFEPFADIYCYFYEKGIVLLSGQGILSFITSNSFLRANYGLSLREFVQKKCNVLALIDIEGSQIFESAIVNTAVAIFGRLKNNVPATIVSTSWTASSFAEFVNANKYQYAQEDFYVQPWTLARPECLQIRQKMENAGKTLEQLDTKIRLGLATGDNNAFVLDEENRKTLLKADAKNKAIIKTVIRGQDIQRYSHCSPQYILLTKNGVNVKRDFPSVYKYLEGFGENFKRRGAKGEHWTNLRACAFFEDFKKEKIIWIELTDLGRFSYSDKEEYLLNSAYFLLPPNGYMGKFMLGVLNSSSIRFFMRQIAATSGMGTLRWINNYVKLFPLPNVLPSQQEEVATLVDQILAAKKKDPEADTSPLEARIDQLVYKLYGLTEEEIAVVEGAGEKKPAPPKDERRGGREAPALPLAADEDDEELE